MGIIEADKDGCDVPLSASYNEPLVVQDLLRSLRCTLSEDTIVDREAIGS